MESNGLAARLKLAREGTGKSQAEVAEAAGIDEGYLADVESGSVPPPAPDTLAALARALDLPYDNLVVLAGYQAPGDGVDGGEAAAAAAAGVDRARIEKAVRDILEAIGEDPDREGLAGTPERVAAMYEEVFSGLRDSPDQHLSVVFAADHDEMVMIKDIPLYSMCEHHLVPFVGRAHVAYIPNQEGEITGLSKLARLVECYARRPQVQERLTTQVADEIDRSLRPRGVLVVIEAEHLCMSMRGVHKPGTTTITSAVRGLFRDSAATRAEALDFLRR